MQNHSIKISLTKFSAPFLLASALSLLAACSDNIATTTSTTVPTAAAIALGTSANWIPTDNSTAATLTATLVDTSNAVMAGIDVSFATTTGNLNASTITTDVNGEAVVYLRSGLADYSNRTATVTASVGGASASIPILIKGSTVSLDVAPSNTIQVGSSTLGVLDTLDVTATAKNAANIGLSNITIRLSKGAASTGDATLSAATLTTGATGATSPFTLTPTVAGTVVLTAEWLDSVGAVTATATQNISVTAANGTAFEITTPALASDPTALSSLATQLLAATVPADIAGVAVASVRISASSGTWTGITQPTAPLSSIMQTPTGGAVAATFTAPANSGSVSVQVDALDASNTVLATLSRTFVISAPSANAAHLFLSSSVSALVPSSGGNISTATLEVSVRDANLNTVGGAAVLFGLLGTTGSGEVVSPAVAITDSTGKATTTFIAGSSPTLASIYAQASVVGEICTAVIQADGLISTETNGNCDAAKLTVSSSAVSVTIGFGSTILDTANATQYKLPGSVLVVNANGSAVAGVPVTLSVFPVAYKNGIIISGKVQDTFNTFHWECLGVFDPSVAPIWDPWTQTWLYTVGAIWQPYEDLNRNGILDVDPLTFINEDTNGNLLLSPPQAAGGTVPLTVTTDSNGAATFELQYPKASAWFIKDEVTARVIVMGTESSAMLLQELIMSKEDKLDPTCPLARTSSY